MKNQTTLTNKHIQQLYELLDSPSNGDKVKRRAQIVLLREETKCTYSEIQKIIGTNPKQIRTWVKRFHEEGISGLYDRKRSGRPSTITEKEKNLIEQILNQSPGHSRINAPVRTWSLATLRTYLVEVYELEISRKHLGRLLHKWGWVYRQVEEDFVRRDPEYELKAQRVKKLIEQPPENCRVLSVDEKGPISVRFHRGRQWQKKDERLAIPKNANKTLGKTVLFGAWDVHSKELFSVFSPRRDTEGFLALLDTLVLDGVDKNYETVYLLLDNLSVHKSKKARAWFENHPQFCPVFLPTYSPQLQPIESLFSVLQREVLDNYWWESVDEIQQAIITWKYFYNAERKSIHPPVQPRSRATRVLYGPPSVKVIPSRGSV